MKEIWIYRSDFNPIDDKDMLLISPLIKEKKKVVAFLRMTLFEKEQREMISLAFKGKIPFEVYTYEDEKEIKEFKEQNSSFHINILQREKEERKRPFFDCPIEVLFYIADHKLYYCEKLSSLMKESRYRHSVSVAKTAYAIALKNHFGNPLKAYIAGLFHDCGKDIDIPKQREICQKHFKEFLPCKDYALHQFVSVHLAKELFFIDDQDILDGIQFHCLGNGKMNELEKIVYCADKVEPTRFFDTKEDREACLNDIDQGFIKVLESQVKYFNKKNICYIDHPLSESMYRNYLGVNYVKKTGKENQ